MKNRCVPFLAAAFLFTTGALASTITVTTLDDRSDFAGMQQVSDLPGPDGKVSFREAVTAANRTSGPQTIAFAVPPSTFYLVPGVGLLRLEKGPFILSDSGTTIDFTTQTTNMGDTNPDGPEIGIYGFEPNGSSAAAIFIQASDCVVKGLGNVHQRGYALQIAGGRNRVVGCEIGGPLLDAVLITGWDNVIGGTGAGDGNELEGLAIVGPAQGNVAIGNPLLRGVRVQGVTEAGQLARNNRIGGPTAAERNVISGFGAFDGEGFPYGAQVAVIDADGTVIEGNFIGTTADGMRAYRPQIGPTGVEVRDARATTIRGNVIAGLRIEGRNHAAGQVFGQAIWINAVNADSRDTLVEGNVVGLGVDQVTAIETYFGIKAAPLSGSRQIHDTRIVRNHVGAVERTGILVTNPAAGVTLIENSVHDSGDLGIDLSHFWEADGPTPNDPGDGDAGANALQNFPELQSATASDGSIAFAGTLDSHPSELYRVEFFASPACDPSGFGEGARFLGARDVTTDASGRATFTVTLPAAVTPGATITATATRLTTGDTSEFSACVTAAAGPPQAMPVAAPSTGTAPLTVAFSSDGSTAPAGAIVSYFWQFGDGETSTEPNPTHVYAAGTYIATLTVTDSNGNSSLDEPVMIEATDPPRRR